MSRRTLAATTAVILALICIACGSGSAESQRRLVEEERKLAEEKNRKAEADARRKQLEVEMDDSLKKLAEAIPKIIKYDPPAAPPAPRFAIGEGVRVVGKEGDPYSVNLGGTDKALVAVNWLSWRSLAKSIKARDGVGVGKMISDKQVVAVIRGEGIILDNKTATHGDELKYYEVRILNGDASAVPIINEVVYVAESSLAKNEPPQPKPEPTPPLAETQPRYKFVNSKQEPAGSGKVNVQDNYVLTGKFDLEQLKALCSEKMKATDSPTLFYHLVVFNSESNVAFSKHPITALYGDEDNKTRFIKAVYVFNRVNGFSELSYYDINMWENIATREKIK